MAEASNMEDMMEDIMEELTVQQVILRSMEDETWDGIESERNEILKEIERLKKKLKKAKRSQPQTVDDGELLLCCLVLPILVQWSFPLAVSNFVTSS